MFCQTCQKALKKLENVRHKHDDYGIDFFHHGLVASLKAAAEDGCRICSPFWEQFPSPERVALLKSDADFPDQMLPASSTDVERGDVDEAGLKRDVDHEATTMTVNPTARDHPPGYRDCAVHVGWERGKLIRRHAASYFVLQPVLLEPADGPWNDHRVQHPSNTGSPQIWSVVEKWAQTCVRSHNRCNELQHSSWYPTRLLDLEYREDAIRLVETRAHACEGRYMTLSHRWGGTNPTCLTRSSYDTMRSGILIGILPAAFQDSIVVCRKLNVRYLWIDSLCIIQDRDDLSDWVKESVLMDKVYSHTFLNISALAATDNSQSIFVDRDPGTLSEARINSFLDDSKTALELGTKEKTYRVLDRNFWNIELSYMPLSLRGWVVQERLLAPRVLHFGSRQLLWECHELEASETFPDGQSHCFGVRPKSLDPTRYSDDPSMGPYALWASIIYEYTGCNITNAGDKLLALAGIAKRMATIMNDEYIAGMWKGQLIYFLLWTAGKKEMGHKMIEGECFKRTSSYRAPSFSWASTEGRIWFPSRHDGTSMVEIVDISLQFVGDNPYSSVKSGSLLLRCTLREAILMRKFARDYRPYRLILKGVEITSHEPSKDIEHGVVRPTVDLDEDDEFFDPVGRDDLYAVPMLTGADYWGTLMLLLQLVDAEHGIYCRRGRIGCETAYKREALEASSPDAEHLPSVGFDGGWHTIRII